MNKMVLIIYNEALDDEIMEVLNRCAGNNYTKVTGVFGRGNTSGTHLGNDTWPGRNNILYAACEDLEAKKFSSRIMELRKALGKEGVKAFVMSLD